MFVKEMIEKVKQGDESYKKHISKYYLYVARKIHQQYQDKITFIEFLKIYRNLLENYYNEDYQYGINHYLTSRSEVILKNKFKEPRQNITDLIRNAKTGDKRSRDKLINHYSFIVERTAKNYDYLEYEDLVQYGMIKLISFIDRELLNGDGSLFTAKLTTTIERYFDTNLKNEIESQNIDCESNYCLNNNVFMEKVFELELKDLINSEDLSEKDKLSAMKYFIHGLSLNQIGAVEGCTKQAASLRIKKVVQRIKYEYTK